MRVRYTGVRVEYVDHEADLWCTKCLMHSGLRLWVAVSTEWYYELQARLWCVEHEDSDGIEEPD